MAYRVLLEKRYRYELTEHDTGELSLWVGMYRNREFGVFLDLHREERTAFRQQGQRYVEELVSWILRDPDAFSHRFDD